MATRKTITFERVACFSSIKLLQNLCTVAFWDRGMPTPYLPWEHLHELDRLRCPLQSNLLQSLNLLSRIRTMTVIPVIRSPLCQPRFIQIQ